MHKIIFLLAFGAILWGCSNQKSSENKTANTTKLDNAPANSAVSNSNRTGDASVPGRNQPGAKIEEPRQISFEPGKLPDGWRWLDADNQYNPTRYDTESGVLRIEVPSGKDLYGDTRNAPQLLTSIAGDFEIETKINFDPKDSYQGAGILVLRNDNNYMRLERGVGGVGGGENGIRFDVREDESYEPIATQEKYPTDAKTVELKMRRVGREFSGFWRLPGGEWKEVGKFTVGYPETVQVGLIACNTAEEIPVEFSYIKLNPLK